MAGFHDQVGSPQRVAPPDSAIPGVCSSLFPPAIEIMSAKAYGGNRMASKSVGIAFKEQEPQQ